MLRIVAFVIVCVLIGCASTKPAARVVAPSADPRPAPDTAKGPPVAWVLDRYVYAADAGGEQARIGPELLEEFIRERKIEPTEAQLVSFERWLAKNGRGEDIGEPEFNVGDDPEGLRTMARAVVRGWLIDEALYEQYGGTVIFQQANPMEPVGAYRAFFEEQERRGRLEIFDATQRETFWAYLKREDHPFQIPKDRIDFSKPWWEQRVQGR